MAIVNLPVSCARISFLANSAFSGVATPTPRHPHATPARISSGVSPTITTRLDGLTPSNSQALVTGNGSGFGGPSSMQTETSNK
eukprot:CAMPEP_0198249664 /NCGR_PEP_ID=MMETSP1447-20131203/1113_1 /TAXON_ID=420782 /ORGANISM="Chaetoceros dichaeta, Strain CCMP1751" /LENGTH=83 /DNA_ID=CAMNT_0043934347 /DNA_START=158 /DNA_END=409 /DNA_ORIENTATION=-